MLGRSVSEQIHQIRSIALFFFLLLPIVEIEVKIAFLLFFRGNRFIEVKIIDITALGLRLRVSGKLFKISTKVNVTLRTVFDTAFLLMSFPLLSLSGFFRGLDSCLQLSILITAKVLLGTIAATPVPGWRADRLYLLRVIKISAEMILCTTLVHQVFK